MAKAKGGDPPGNPRRLRRWLLRGAFAGLVLAVAGAAALLVYASGIALPSEEPPERTTVLYFSDGEPLASLSGDQRRTLVALADVPPVVRDAVIAAEDRRFYDHRGVDPIGVLRALWADIRSKGSRQGGSTITQQYVKNVYVGRERTLQRKVREAVLATKVERQLSKDEILERYLNTIYFGRGAYGIQAAAQAWYAKDVGQLDAKEAAYLAALIRSPEGTDVARHPERAKARRSSVIAAMVRAGTLDPADAAVIEDTPISSYVVRRQDLPPDVKHSDIGTHYIVDWVRSELVARYGEQVVLGGGLQVTTTIDRRLQGLAWDAVNGTLTEREPAGALVAVDEEGRVVALVGGRDHSKSQVNLALGRAGGGSGRQAGSTFKPFLLAEVVRQGYSVESAFPAPGEIVLRGADHGGDYRVRNYGGEGYPGQMNLVDATRLSVNTVYAQAGQAIGMDRLAAMAAELGVESRLDPEASLVLGAEEVSVLDMAVAYSTLARGGELVERRVVGRVRNGDGEVLDDGRPDRRRVLDERKAAVVTHCLRQVVERGTGTAARLGRPAAGKTGTTNESTDAWFVGYTASPRLTAAVWMGWADDGSRPMDRVRGRPVSGGGLPAQMWRAFMAEATKGAPPGDFPDPGDLGGRTLKGASGREAAGTTTSEPDDSTSTTGGAGAPSTTDVEQRTTTSRSATTVDEPDPSTTKAPATTTTTTAPTTTRATVLGGGGGGGGPGGGGPGGGGG